MSPILPIRTGSSNVTELHLTAICHLNAEENSLLQFLRLSQRASQGCDPAIDASVARNAHPPRLIVASPRPTQYGERRGEQGGSVGFRTEGLENRESVGYARLQQR